MAILILRLQNAKCYLNRTFGAATLLFFRVTESETCGRRAFAI